MPVSFGVGDRPLVFTGAAGASRALSAALPAPATCARRIPLAAGLPDASYATRVRCSHGRHARRVRHRRQPSALAPPPMKGARTDATLRQRPRGQSSTAHRGGVPPLEVMAGVPPPALGGAPREGPR